jgi:putative component of toxin-antitoxin plasmid stabilization module
VIVLLCGGDTSTQERDIRQAHEIANDWRTREANNDQDN